MMKIIMINSICCLIISASLYFHFKRSAGVAVAYNMSVQFAIEQYSAELKTIEEVFAEYSFGMGLYTIILKDTASSEEYASEIKLDHDFHVDNFLDTTREYEKFKRDY